MQKENDIFVFGSNESGRHGRGAAKTARARFGAKEGKGVGLQGKSYGIPTKDGKLKVLPIKVISNYVEQFIKFAEANPDKTFYVTRIGCGLANFKDPQIAFFFDKAPKNCIFDKRWAIYLGKDYEYFEEEL